jgi:hypothetical protein
MKIGKHGVVLSALPFKEFGRLKKMEQILMQ